ncbi:MAG: pyridoxamine 5'-phosphate oxidase family protein [Dehalococcoidia bacterium]
MIPDEHRKFLEEHRLCVVGFNRKSGPPALSPVYYYVDGDEIVFSTQATRGKAKQAERLGEVTLCVLEEQLPFAYLTVYGTVRVDHEGAVDTMMRAAGAMTGSEIPEAARPGFEQRAKEENRVALRVTPTGFFSTRTVAPKAG